MNYLRGLVQNDGVARSLSDFLASDADEERGFRPSSSTYDSFKLKVVNRLF